MHMLVKSDMTCTIRAFLLIFHAQNTPSALMHMDSEPTATMVTSGSANKTFECCFNACLPPRAHSVTPKANETTDENPVYTRAACNVRSRDFSIFVFLQVTSINIRFRVQYSIISAMSYMPKSFARDLKTNEDFNTLEDERTSFTPHSISGVTSDMPKLSTVVIPAGTLFYRGFGGSVQPPDCDIKRKPSKDDFAFESSQFTDRGLWFGPRSTAIVYCAKNSTQIVYAETAQAKFEKCQTGGNYLETLRETKFDSDLRNSDTMIPLYYISGDSGVLVTYETTRDLVLLDVAHQPTLQALKEYKLKVEKPYNDAYDRARSKYREGNNYPEGWSKAIQEEYGHHVLPWSLDPFVGEYWSDIMEEEGPIKVKRNSDYKQDALELKGLCTSIEGIDGWMHFYTPELKAEIALCFPKKCVRIVNQEDAAPHVDEKYAIAGLPSQSEFRAVHASLRRRVNSLFEDFESNKTFSTDENAIRLVDHRFKTNFF